MDTADQSDAAVDPMAVDFALFGCWQATPAYHAAWHEDDPLVEDVRAVVLETKSGAGVSDV